MKKSTNSTDTSVETKTPVSRRPVWFTVIGVVGLLAIAGTLTSIAYASQSTTIARNVMVGSFHVGGLDTLTALDELESRWKQFRAQAFVFMYEGEAVSIPVSNVSRGEEEVIFDLASFDLQASLDQAFDYGHTGPLWQQAWERVLAYLGQEKSFGSFALSSEGLQEQLEKSFGQHDLAATNAGIEYDPETGVSVTQSAAGVSMNYAQAIATAKQRLRALDQTPITLSTILVQPGVASTPEMAAVAEREVPEVLQKAPFTLAVGEQSWLISPEGFRTLLGFVETNGRTTVGLDHDKTVAYLETLREEIDVEPREAKFQIAGEKVSEFQTSVVGVTLNVEASFEAIVAALFEHSETLAALVVEEVVPLTDTHSTNDLGITELVAEGETDFRGSPPNRVFNLSLGADRINGLLLKPGEVFSLVDALGPIDGPHGWKPELVIKGTQITPEFGGGLCQVATTLFRAALNTGLEIVERRNHSLRVSYYEPPIGLDATIYEPKPDLRFRNDYETALLIQTRVEGTKLIFSFYGTKDGRSVDIPTPYVYNKTAIPPTERSETDELAPGEEECQSGHPGADAVATYTVTKADGTSETVEFKSHYRPLPKICRVGKAAEEPAAETPADES